MTETIVGVVKQLGSDRISGGVVYELIRDDETVIRFSAPKTASRTIEDGDVVSFGLSAEAKKTTTPRPTGTFKNMTIYDLPLTYRVEFVETNEMLETLIRNLSGSDRIADAVIEDLTIEANHRGVTLSELLYEVAEERVNEGKVYSWWVSHRIRRRLWLLGFQTKTIDDACEYLGCNVATLYDKLMANPLAVVTIPLSMALRIAAEFELNPSPKEIAVAEIARWIHDQTTIHRHTYVPLTVLKGRYPTSEPYYTVLEKDYGIYFDQNEGYCQYEIYKRMEETIARRIVELKKRDKLPRQPVYIEEGFEPHQLQQIAIEASLCEPMMMILGGPGRGKTKIIRMIAANLTRLHRTYVITAVSATAVELIRDALDGTGADMERIMTTHMLVTLNGKVDFDHLIIDEASMENTSLIYDLFRIYDFKFLTLIGDPNQLQPVKWGCFLHQLIDSKSIPSIKLSHNFRARNPVYVFNSDGIVPSNHCIMEKGSTADVIRHYKALLDKGVTKNQISIVTTTNDVVATINSQCQLFNTNPSFVIDGQGRKFIVGDRVVLKKNNYAEKKWNGSVGTISAIDKSHKFLHVEFANGQTKRFVIMREQFDKQYAFHGDGDKRLTTNWLELATCVTIHSAQGFEREYIIFFVPKENKKRSVDFFNFYMINTATSRARVWLAIIGEIDELQKYFKLKPESKRERLGLLIKQGLSSK